MRFLNIFISILIMAFCSQPSETGDKTFTYLALGDSYTIGESVDEKQRFPVQLTEQLKNNGFKIAPATIVARTGWTTDELALGIENSNLKEHYNLVTLLIGVNNQYRGRDAEEYRRQFVELLKTAIKFAQSDAKSVAVLSIPDYGVTPFAKNSDTEKIAREIDVFNQINREESYRMNVRYIDITPISREAKTNPNLVANDGLHPSGEMYSLWVEKLLPIAEEILLKQAE